MLVIKDVLKKMMLFFIFIILLLVVSTIFQVVHQYMDRHSHYNKPIGDAVKVFQSTSAAIEKTTIPDRFVWFLLYGE